MWRRLPRLVVISLALGVATTTSAAPPPPRPRLGVLLIFDQLPMWLFERYAPLFSPPGFGGLDGAVHSAWYPYASTETAPGHATIATGSAPSVHGGGHQPLVS